MNFGGPPMGGGGGWHRHGPEPRAFGGKKPSGDEKHGKVRSFEESSVTNWISPEDAVFTWKNGFLYFQSSDERRVTLARAFPFEHPWEYISVLDEEQNEIGIIRSVEAFPEDCRELLKKELQRRYYAPVILKILSMKERYGFSHWKVETKEGIVGFTLHDTYKSIIHAGGFRLIFLDVDGNRFEIPDTRRMDVKSQKKVELYL